eukprot:Blabericola_migrator_1__7228@NODE_366_length_9388_cov_56_375818_g293_i0_p2_GENE_NODE_366_length_9388_cov_56_375818_g293_i0NODE_366_length_9388_cov_56_375818_g293_i0_p2_ORF_typecomplete_len585_score85_00TauE/PF01925_19/2_4e11TauE/PF01925_19/0_067TauE/PF01925_19/9_9e22_NODE_366_length_9388_cov_56_375818_g293_i014913245
MWSDPNQPFFWLLAGLCLVAGVLASISGTGGGSLFIPIFSLAFPNDVHRAVPLSKVAVLGVALGACIVNFTGIRGAKRNSSYINYELATLIQPATLMGTRHNHKGGHCVCPIEPSKVHILCLGCLFGVFLNLLLPSVVIASALVGILSFVAYKTYKAGFEQRQSLIDSVDDDLANAAQQPPKDKKTPSTADDDLPTHTPTQSSPVIRCCTSVSATLEEGSDTSPKMAERFHYFHITDTTQQGGAITQARRVSQGEEALKRSEFAQPVFTQTRLNQFLTPETEAVWVQDTSVSEGGNEYVSEFTPLVPPTARSSRAPRHTGSHHPGSSFHFHGRDPETFAATSTTGRTWEILYLIMAWAVNALCLAAAGGPAALACGPVANRIWLYGLIAFQLSFICWTGSRLKQRKAASAQPRQWWWVQEKKMIWYCFLSCVAGCCAGLLGIGGGLIKGPLLISIGLLPINAVATSNYMILFTSSTNVLAFILAGRLHWQHSAVFTGLTLMGGLLGATVLKNAFNKSQKQYILTFILATSIVIGGLAMTGVNIREILLRANGQDQNIHEKTFAEACRYLEAEPSLWERLRLVDI